MADTQTSGLDAVNTETPQDETVRIGGGSKPLVANEAVLQSMLELKKQKEAANNYWLQDLADAQAWWSGGAAGPVAGLSERAKVRAKQQEELQAINAGIAGQQNALELRDMLMGKRVPTTAPTTAGAPSAATAGAPTAGGQQASPAQAKAGAQVVSERTGGLLGLLPPQMQMAIGASALVDMKGAINQTVNFISKQMEDPQALKELRFLIQSGAVNANDIPAAIRVKILGSGAFTGTEVGTATGETKKTTPFAIAGAGTTPIQGAPMQGAPMQGAPAPAPRPPVPTPPQGGTPTTTTPTGGNLPQIKPVQAPQPAVTPTPMTPTAPTSTGPVTSKQSDVLGGYVTPGTTQAGDVLKAAALGDIEAGTKGKAAGLEKKYKDAEAEGTQVLTNWQEAETLATNASRMKELAERNKETLGIFKKPGPGVAIAQELDKGLKLGPLGTIGIPLEEVAVRLIPGSSGQAIRDREQLESLLNDQQIAMARMNKGQGQWSDFERRIMSGIVGSVSNSAEFLIRRGELLERRAEFDQKLGDAFRAYRSTHKNALYADFQDTNQYADAVKEYKQSLRSQFDKEFRKGKDVAAPLSGNTQSILNRYPETKK
jgi:hypothetical protein